MSEKKFFWLKLKESFFEEKYIKALRKIPGGNDIVIVYLKMQLKSLKTEGIISYDKIMPSPAEELALVLDEDVNIVKATLIALEKFKLIEIWDNDAIYMTALQELIGSESSVTRRVRKHRELKEALQCNAIETKCNTEKEIEKEIEIELEAEKSKKHKQTPKQIFEAYASGVLLETLFEFIEMRKANKAPLTPNAAKLLTYELDKLGNDDYTKVKILEQSILNGWKGVFPLKNSNIINKQMSPQDIMAIDMSYLDKGRS